jgi:hypothetical protein
MKNHFLCSLLAVTTLVLSSCCCISGGDNETKLSSQGSTGSPHVGLLPTMKVLTP